MASLRDYFDTDFIRQVQLDTGYVMSFRRPTGEELKVEIPFKSIWDEESNARYPTFFVPQDAARLEVCTHLVDRCEALYAEAWAGLETEGGTARWGDYDQVASAHLVDTRQVFLYADTDFAPEEVATLRAYGRSRNRVVRLRERKWAKARDGKERPVVFISHDSRDKSAIARPLAQKLAKTGCPVWFDEYSLAMGDSLRTSIERGLKECEKCVIIITPNFLSNGGWTKVEFEAVFQRELLQKTNLLLPVWAGITKDQIFDYAPFLLDRLAAHWDEGEDAVAAKIRGAVGRT